MKVSFLGTHQPEGGEMAFPLLGAAALAARVGQIGYRAYKGGKVLQKAKKAVRSAIRWLDSDVFTWTSKSGEVMKRTGTAVKTKTGKVAVRSPRGGQTFVGKGTKRRWSVQKATSVAGTALSTGYALVPKVESEKEYPKQRVPHDRTQTTSKSNLKSLKQAPWSTHSGGAGGTSKEVRKRMEEGELGIEISPKDLARQGRGEEIAMIRRKRGAAISKRRKASSSEGAKKSTSGYTSPRGRASELSRDLAKRGPGGYDVYKKGSPTAESFRRKWQKEKDAGKKTFTWNNRKYTTE